MKLIPRLLALLSPVFPALPAQPVRPADAVPGDEPCGDDDVGPRGCGWFDSSHELHCGLTVREHASPDTLAQELPLSSWLDLHLSNWTVPTAVASAM